MMSRITLGFVACCVLTGCERGPAPAPGAAAAAADSVSTDSVFSPSMDRVTLPTSRIYFTLTSHEWYARGEPLVHDGRAYRPGGMPVGASLTEMSRAGEYGGVEYYVRNADPGAVLYVPVFQGYWQTFRLDATGVVPVDADLPDDAPPDSLAADTTTVGV